MDAGSCSRQLHAAAEEDRTLKASLRLGYAQGRTSQRPECDFARTLPTVPRVLRCLEYVVGFSFRVRPTAYLSLQDGWFGACGPDGWLHESYMSRIGVTQATVANLMAARAGLTPADSTRIAPVSHQLFVKSSVINGCGATPTTLKLLLPTAAASH